MPVCIKCDASSDIGVLRKAGFVCDNCVVEEKKEKSRRTFRTFYLVRMRINQPYAVELLQATYCETLKFFTFHAGDLNWPYDKKIGKRSYKGRPGFDTPEEAARIKLRSLREKMGSAKEEMQRAEGAIESLLEFCRQKNYDVSEKPGSEE